MKVGESLLVCDFKFLGAAYDLIHHIPADGPAKLDLIPTSEGATLLVSGEINALVDLLRKAKDMNTNRLIENIGPSVIEAYLGLSNPPLSDSLVVFESRMVGDVFEAAVRLESAGYKVFDLRILRGGAPRAYVLATGAQAETPITTENLSGQLTTFSHPGPRLREFFALSSQK